MRHFIQSIIVVIATLAALLVIWELRSALVLFGLALALAAPTRGPIAFWIARGLPRSLAILLTYLLGLALLLGLLILVSGPVLRDLQQASNLLDRAYRQITTALPGDTPFQQMISQQLPPPQTLYNAIAGEQGLQLVLSLVGAASGLMGNLANLAIILMLSLYWSFYRQGMEHQGIALLPVGQRRRAREIWRELEDGVGGYMRSEIAQSVLGGLLLGVGYAVMGLSFPALIALIGALLWLIPWLGAGLAVVLPLLAGLYAGPVLAFAAPLYTIAVLTFLELVVQPRMFNRRPYSSLLIVLVLVPLAEAYGLLGLLVAPPLAAAIQTLYTSLRQPALPAVTPQGLVLEASALHERVKNTQAQIAQMETEAPPAALSLLSRLAALAEQSTRLIEDGEDAEGQGGTARDQRPAEGRAGAANTVTPGTD